MDTNLDNLIREFSLQKDNQEIKGKLYSLIALEESGIGGNISKFPICIRVILESLIRNLDGNKVDKKDVENLANWSSKKSDNYEIPFKVGRIVLQDFTGVPLLVDIAAMRDAAASKGFDPKDIEPLVPVDLVIDHSIQVDFSSSKEALRRNMEIEFIRNRERYKFLKWGQQAFEKFSVIPPGIGIVHQVNLEYLAKGILEKDGVYYPDSLVGTDSHTTMINGLGIVGWGVGGIEAEAGMLDQPVTFLVPQVVGVYMHGDISEGVTATDLALKITEMLRKHGVVGKFVEFYGPGAQSLSLADRATIANMAPEYGATMGFFPIDEESINYLRGTGRDEEDCNNISSYYKAQGMFGIPQKDQCDYSEDLDLDLSLIKPSVSGPKRPQDRIDVTDLYNKFNRLFTTSLSDGGFGEEVDSRDKHVNFHLESSVGEFKNPLLNNEEIKKIKYNGKIEHGSIVIASITSCTNTSNPSVMIAAGLIAKRANELGLKIPAHVKTSLGPGSRVVTSYLEKTGLQKELDNLGFQTVGYGCTTCIGNSGPLHPSIEEAIKKENLVCASVLSGNRNFEARIHGAVRANFLMSPPLVVAYALVGRVDVNLMSDIIGVDKGGREVYFKDLWPTSDQINKLISSSLDPRSYNEIYNNLSNISDKWSEIEGSKGHVYSWDKESTYIQSPPFFDQDDTKNSNIKGARLLGFFGDSVTTDHISPAGAIKESSPAGQYLLSNGVNTSSFNSYGARRGNDRVMTRGTFANVRIRNLMCENIEGGYTQYFGDNEVSKPDQDINSIFSNGNNSKPTFIYDASLAYKKDGVSLIVIGGKDYGMGSSRDWAAKGTRLLGVKAVVTKSFERIHRSNLIGMGVMPLNFSNSEDYEKVKKHMNATFDIIGIDGDLKPMQDATLIVNTDKNKNFEIPLLVRLDTPIEIEYYKSGGILPYVLNSITD